MLPIRQELREEASSASEKGHDQNRRTEKKRKGKKRRGEKGEYSSSPFERHIGTSFHRCSMEAVEPEEQNEVKVGPSSSDALGVKENVQGNGEEDLEAGGPSSLHDGISLEEEETKGQNQRHPSLRKLGPRVRSSSSPSVGKPPLSPVPHTVSASSRNVRFASPRAADLDQNAEGAQFTAPRATASALHMSMQSNSSFDSKGSTMLRRATTGGALRHITYVAMQEEKRNGEAESQTIEPEVSGIPLFEVFKATRRLKAQSKCVEGVVFFIFMLCFALVVIELRKTSLAGETTEALLDFFLQEEFVAVDVEGLENQVPFFQKTYKEIKTAEEWWLWTFGPLMEGLYFGFANGSVPFGLPMGTGQNYVMGGSDGGILVRSFRVTELSCEDKVYGTLQLQELDNACFGPWPKESDRRRVQKDAFGPAVDSDDLDCPDLTWEEEPGLCAFTYTNDTGSVLEGTLLGGVYFDRSHYGKGGYAIDLPVNNPNNISVQALEYMFENNWIDVATRVVSVEFNVFNPSTHIVTTVRFFTEFSQTGMVRPSHRFYFVNGLMWENLNPPFYIAVVIFLILLMAFTRRWFVRVFSCTRWNHMFRWKVIFDGFLLLLFWISIVTVAILTANSEVIRQSRFRETMRSTFFTGGIFETGELMHNVDALYSINLMLATVKLISYLPFKTTRTIWATLGGAIKDILVLGAVVLLFWAGFSLGSHITFGSLGLYEFDRIDRTFGTLMVLMFSGNVDFNSMREVSFTAAPLFYAVYMIFMWGVMLNLFVAIIVLTYERYTQWQANFDTWTEQHHGTNSGCIIMTYPEYWVFWIRRGWYTFKMCRLQRKKSTVENSTGDILRTQSQESDDPARMQSSRFLSGRQRNRASSLDRAFRINTVVVDVGKLRAQLDAIRKLKLSPEEWKDAVQRQGNPHKRLFREVWRRHLWKLAVQKTERHLNTYSEGFGQESTFMKKWRNEFDEQKGSVDTNAKSFWDYMGEGCCCCRFHRVEEDLSVEAKRRSFGRKTIFDFNPSLRALPATQRKRNAAREYHEYEAVRSQEKELVDAKRDIEKILCDTQILFKKHRMSFNRLLRLTWAKSGDDERLQALTIAELQEMLSPGCIASDKTHLRCTLCSKTKITERAERLLAHYALLQSRRSVFKGNRRRVMRVKRLNQLSIYHDPSISSQNPLRLSTFSRSSSVLDTNQTPRSSLNSPPPSNHNPYV